jgi:hypothetical protein
MGRNLETLSKDYQVYKSNPNMQFKNLQKKQKCLLSSMLKIGGSNSFLEMLVQ